MKIAVFASGNGSNFQAIIDRIKDGYLKDEIVLVVVDKPDAYVIARAIKEGVNVFSFNPKDYRDKKTYEELILRKCRENKVEFIVLAGYMRLLGNTLLAAYPDKIINIHPSLLPAFKGKDAIGQAIAYGVKVMGVSIHYVNKEMDGGRIIAQKAFEVDECWSKEDIEAKIHQVEHELYPKVIKEIGEGL